MTFEEYALFAEKAYNVQKEYAEVFKEQHELSIDCKAKMDAFYEIDDKLYDLYTIGTKKMNEMFPNSFTVPDDTKYNNLCWVSDQYANNYSEVKSIIDKMNTIPELKEAGELEPERQKRFIDYAMAQVKLDNSINETKKKLFTKEYLNKMEEYANEGVLLYFLETPDIPILDKDVNPELLLDVLLFNDCMDLKTFYHSFVSFEGAGEPLKRKIKDIVDVINNLVNGCYRTAARTMFALLESESKNISCALEDFFEKEHTYKRGKQRSEIIEELTKYMDMPNAQKEWEMINNYYEKLVTGKDAFIDRNKLIHGDYSDSSIDINAHDVAKLLLLYLSFRMHGDYIQNHIKLYTESLSYVFTSVARELKDKNND